MSTIEAIRCTPEDLLTMPGGERYELVDGHLVEKPTGAESDWIGMRMIARMVMFVEAPKLGYVFGPETGYQCFRDDPNKVRKPDGSYIAAGRLPGNRIPKGHIRIVPDLVIEVISPNDLYYEVEAEVREYQTAGVRLIWVVNPDLRTVKVYDSQAGRVFDLSEGDRLTGGEVLPGFSCLVSDLFPPSVEG